MYRNVAGQGVCAQMVARSDGTDLTTGVSVMVTKDTGTQTAGAGTLMHKGSGQWCYTPTQAETDAGVVCFQFLHATGVTQLVSLYPTVLNDYADAILKRDWTAVTGEAARSALNALRFLRNKWSIVGTTLTVTKEDDATTAYTATLTTSASAEAVTSSDPN